MDFPRIRSTTQADEAAAVHAIVLAFSADPTARWMWPDAHRYLTHMPAFARAFGGSAFPNGSAYCTDDLAGAALWLPPGVHPDEEALGQIMQETLSESVRNDLASIFETLGSYHPSEPHWYLPLIGVDPLHHGKGYGGKLMEHVLQRCDRDGTPAYLESSNPRNITLYERHGYRVLGEVRSGDSPPLIPMLRDPQ